MTSSSDKPHSSWIEIFAVLALLLTLWGLMALGFAWLDRATLPMQGPSDTGDALRARGWPAFALGAIGATLALSRVRRAAKRAVVIASGAWPFLAFFVFLQWRIGLSTEQLAACEAGEAWACDTLAGRKAKRGDDALAQDLYARGCALGDGHACLGLAALVGPADPRGAGALRAACALDEGTACDRLSRALRRGDTAALHPDEAREVRSRACALGVASACDGEPPP